MRPTNNSYSRHIDFGIILEKNNSLDLAFSFLNGNPDVSNLIRSNHVKWGEDIIFFVFQGFSFAVLSSKGASITACAVEKVHKYGARSVVFIGTCGSTNESILEGTYLLPYAAVRDEGTTSGYLDIKCPAVAHPGLISHLRAQFENHASDSGITYTTDKRYRENPEELRELFIHANVQSVDMETAAFFIVSTYHGLAASAIRIVTDCAVKETDGDLKGVYSRDEPFEDFVHPKLIFALKASLYGLISFDKKMKNDF